MCQDARHHSSLQQMPMCSSQTEHCMLKPPRVPSVFTFWRKAFQIFYGYIHNFCIIVFIWYTQFCKQLFSPTEQQTINSFLCCEICFSNMTFYVYIGCTVWLSCMGSAMASSLDLPPLECTAHLWKIEHRQEQYILRVRNMQAHREISAHAFE